MSEANDQGGASGRRLMKWHASQLTAAPRLFTAVSIIRLGNG